MKKTIALLLAGTLGTGTTLSLLAAENSDNSSPYQNHKKWQFILNKVDTDGDQLISLEEFLAARTVKAERRFDYIDSDDSAGITLEEAKAAIPERDFDPNEIRACVSEKLGIDLPERQSLAELFNTVDADVSGIVDWQEYLNAKLEFATSRFSTIDTSGDGYLDASEIQQSFQNQFALRQAIKECREELQSVTDLIGD